MSPRTAHDCFHCGLPIPRGSRWLASIDGEQRALCCAGCAALAELISGSGLSAYYQFREEPGPKPPWSGGPSQELLHYDEPALQLSFMRHPREGVAAATLSIDDMRCAGCVWLLETHLSRCAGVVSMRVHLGAARAELEWEEGTARLSTLLAEISRLGYRARPYRPDWHEAARTGEYHAALRRLVVAGLGAMQAMMYAVGLYFGAAQGMSAGHQLLLRVVSALVSTPVVFYAGGPFFGAAWRDLKARRLGMDVPVALALAIAWASSLYATASRSGEVYFESVAMFVFFLSLGRFVEMRARQRAAAAVEAALRRPPATAARLCDDGSSETVIVQQLGPGDRVLVRPGESFPADGRVTAGSGWVNESMLTGEHWPRRKALGDEVLGGTQNGESPLTVLVARTGAETVWASIVRIMDEAGRSRPQIARLADRVAAVFVPSVLVASALTAAIWSSIDPSRAFWIALSVLVVTCPCALSLAAPAALTAACGAALSKGVLLRSGLALETLQKITHVVFDKTGTLTLGRFRRRAADCLGPMDESRCLAAAASLERLSEHPIAEAFRDVAQEGSQATGVSAEAGAGIEGALDGVRTRIGRLDWVAQLSNAGSAGSAASTHGTSVWLGNEGGLLARFDLEDTLRPGTASAIERLRARGLAVHLVSGDSFEAVRDVASRVGIERPVHGATPADKLGFVRELQARGACVLMVGDGVNDAPVLGAAQVSIAMGGGSDLSRANAGGVLMHDSLLAVADVIDLARKTRRVMRQNLCWAVVYNVVALPLAASGHVTPWLAAIGMSLSSLVVVVNAVRLGAAQRTAATLADKQGLPVYGMDERTVAFTAQGAA